MNEIILCPVDASTGHIVGPEVVARQGTVSVVVEQSGRIFVGGYVDGIRKFETGCFDMIAGQSLQLNFGNIL